MPLSEKNLKNKVIQFIKKNYPHIWIYKTADRWTAGIPDLLLCNKGLLYAIELKVGKNRPTKIQRYVLKRIRSAGGRAAVCWSLDDVKNFLEGGVQQ
jgi:hypothetical protein